MMDKESMEFASIFKEFMANPIPDELKLSRIAGIGCLLSSVVVSTGNLHLVLCGQKALPSGFPELLCQIVFFPLGLAGASDRFRHLAEGTDEQSEVR